MIDLISNKKSEERSGGEDLVTVSDDTLRMNTHQLTSFHLRLLSSWLWNNCVFINF
jgi:hypothetical protein